jgi:anti-sigma factor RsiW
MSCRQLRRELLEQVRYREELGSRSGRHLSHLELCASCRDEVGIDRELVAQLSKALRERVEGSAPSAVSWELVRRRALERPVSRWTVRILQLGRLLPAATAAVMIFAIASTSPPGLVNGTRPAAPVTSTAEQAHQRTGQTMPVAWQPSWQYQHGPQGIPGLPSQPNETPTNDVRTIGDLPPIPGRMQ